MTTRTVTVFAMTQKGHAVVESIAHDFPELLAGVVIGRDKAVADDYAGQLQALCAARGIPWWPREEAPRLASDYALAVSWRWLLAVPDDRLIVLHDSLLPRYRGFAPMVNALVNGERELGVTALFGVSDYDRGDIICQRRSAIDYPVTIQQAIELNLRNYRAVVGELCGMLRAGIALPRVPQCEDQASYSIWRDDDDYRVDWSASAAEIRRLVDAVGPPYGGARTHDGEHQVIIDAAEEQPDVRCERRDAGKVIFMAEGCPVVICGSGLLKITAARFEAADGSLRPYLPMKRFRVRFR